MPLDWRNFLYYQLKIAQYEIMSYRRGLNSWPPDPYHQIQFIRREQEGEGEHQYGQWQNSSLYSNYAGKITIY